MNKTAMISLIVIVVLVAGGVAVAASHKSSEGEMASSTAMTDSTQTQGVMVGGALMTPDRDIVENAMNASNVTTVVAAVSAAGLVDTLKGTGPFTVFAPNNDAFAKLPAGTVDAS